VIARCTSAADVVEAVGFAREHDLLTAVRAGGHSLSGKSTCEGGIVIDLSPMQDVRVDPTRRVARVEGGALLQHLDRATRSHALVTTAGTVSHTGAAGLTLGGGFGRVGRRFGLACDNLRSVDVVTAAGRRITASADRNSDLFWALRGGGGNFGVATAFEYNLHAMDPTILGGNIAWPVAQAREVLRFYAEFAERAPDELNIDAGLVRRPDGAGLVLFQVCWSADKAAGEKVLQPLRSFGRPVMDTIAAMAYVDLQSSGDESNAHGRRFYAKAGFLPGLTPTVIDTMVDTFEAASPKRFNIVMQHGGGAIGRTPIEATAFPNREARQWVMIASGWKDATLDDEQIGAVRGGWKHIEPLTSGFYVNSATDDDAARVGANYGRNYPRLQRIKKAYDPKNLFRLNANVQPA
jgi:FAD/FMN-containing dehydrogenase